MDIEEKLTIAMNTHGTVNQRHDTRILKLEEEVIGETGVVKHQACKILTLENSHNASGVIIQE